MLQRRTTLQKKRQKRQIKKEQFEENVRLKNVEAARKEISAVQSREMMAKLYGKTEQGGWEKEKVRAEMASGTGHRRKSQ